MRTHGERTCRRAGKTGLLEERPWRSTPALRPSFCANVGYRLKVGQRYLKLEDPALDDGLPLLGKHADDRRPLAERDDEESAEYSIVSGDGEDTEVLVCSEISYQSAPVVDGVVKVPPAKIKRFMVRGESVPTYYAREIE